MYINKRRTTKYRLETRLLMTVYHRLNKMLRFKKNNEIYFCLLLYGSISCGTLKI